MAENDDPRTPSRFYATIDAGRMECPACGRLLLWGILSGKRPHKHPRRRPSQHIPDGGVWDPILSTIRCNGCATEYQLGIIAWPVRVRIGRPPTVIPRKIPVDQRADIRQATELRRLAGGFWPWVKEAPSAVNRYVPEGCTCTPRRDPACPIHGAVGPFTEERSGGESEDSED